VKQLDKEPDIEAISLDNIDTTSQWRVEIQEPEMEEAPEWLEEHADNLMEEGATKEEEEEEEEEEEDDVPLLVDTEAEEEIGLPVDPMPPPPPQRAIPGVGLGSVGIGRRKHTFPSTSSPSLTTLEGASGAVGSSTPTSSRVPPRPPTASRGKLVPFTRKRARAATTPRHRGNQ